MIFDRNQPEKVGSKHIKHKLSGDQNKILAKGVNYTVTPNKVPTEQKDKYLAGIAGVLKSATAPKHNLTKQERTVI